MGGRGLAHKDTNGEKQRGVKDARQDEGMMNKRNGFETPSNKSTKCAHKHTNLQNPIEEIFHLCVFRVRYKSPVGVIDEGLFRHMDGLYTLGLDHLSQWVACGCQVNADCETNKRNL